MEIAVLSVIAVLFATGTYLLLDRTLLRVVIGLGLLSNGANLLLLASSGLGGYQAPILRDAASPVVDPLPQALILTAIVIGFGVTALLLTISYRTYQGYRSDNLEDLHGRLGDE
jgi:multicomponent Na+:H+ antiporter subunit C